MEGCQKDHHHRRHQERDDRVRTSVHPIKAIKRLITTSVSGGELGMVGILSSSVQPIKATIGSRGLGVGRGCELGESLSTSVQPFKATNDSRTGSSVEGIWEIGGREGKDGGFVDRITVEEMIGEWLGD